MNKSSDSIVRVPAWRAHPWLLHGFSTRAGGVSKVYLGADGASGGPTLTEGDLNLGWTKEDDHANVARNRTLFVEALLVGKPVGTAVGTTHLPLVTVRQVHAALTLEVPDASIETLSAFVDAEGRALLQADGLMTAASGMLLGIQTADCVPVLVADTKKRVVAAFHAGWRGTAARIVEQGIARMVANFDSRPDDLIAAVGPSIGACCYTVGDEVLTAFTRQFVYGDQLLRKTVDNHHHPSGSATWRLDLWEANRRQLQDAGLPPSKIVVVGECTGCAGLPGSRRYFSHRCEAGGTGRMMTAIGVMT